MQNKEQRKTQGDGALCNSHPQTVKLYTQSELQIEMHHNQIENNTCEMWDIAN